MKNDLSSYEKAGSLLRLLGWLALSAAICFALAALAHLFGTRALVPGNIRTMVVAAVFCAVYLRVGTALKENKPWARTAGIVLGVIALPGIPIGTLIGAYLLWCLLGKSEDEQKQPGQVPPLAAATAPPTYNTPNL